MNKFHTANKEFEVEIPELAAKDPEEIYRLISDISEEIALINISNYVKLYNSINEQFPVNIHQFCKFIPAEYRSELKYICGEFS